MTIELAQVDAAGHLARRTGEGEDRRARQNGGADGRGKEQLASGREAAVPDLHEVADLLEVFAHGRLLPRDLLAVHLGIAAVALLIAQGVRHGGEGAVKSCRWASR